MKKIMLLIVIILIGAILFSCAPKSIPGEKPAILGSLDQGIKALSKADWELEWEKALAEGRKEGKVVIYSPTSADRRQALMEHFPARTGIALEIVVSSTASLPAKMLSEQRYGLFLADVYLGSNSNFTAFKSAGAFAPLKPALFLPEVLDTKLWYGNALPWYDKDQTQLTTRMNASQNKGATFLRDSVAKAEITSWYDLLKPRFKRVMNMKDPTLTGSARGLIFDMVYHYGLGWDYVKDLVKQEPVLMLDDRLQVDWVVRGKQIVAIHPSPYIVQDYVDAGAPLISVFFKGAVAVIGGGHGNISLITRAPHPNAAKLFINWFLSKEGQTVYHRASRKDQSARMDTPTDYVSPENIRQPGVEYVIDREEYMQEQEKLAPRITELFTPLRQ